MQNPPYKIHVRFEPLLIFDIGSCLVSAGLSDSVLKYEISLPVSPRHHDISHKGLGQSHRFNPLLRFFPIFDLLSPTFLQAKAT
jgi:hypothetical protein